MLHWSFPEDISKSFSWNTCYNGTSGCSNDWGGGLAAHRTSSRVYRILLVRVVARGGKGK